MTPPPQRTARLYRALVDTGLVSSVQGLLIATAILLVLMALPSIKKAREEAFQEEDG